MIKVTFTLDEGSVSYLKRMSDRLGVSKSMVVREALHLYGEHLSRLSEEERDRLLEVFDAVTTEIPDRPRKEVERELSESRVARLGGRRISYTDGSG